uniref:talin-2-like n=1 Tax=Myxine glutinosa TaxID=7769 RepID=UPI00358E49C6
MVALSLKICILHCNVVKTMQFEPSMVIHDACGIIQERAQEAQDGRASEYGLFLADEDPKKGIWLDSSRTLDHYMLRNGDILEFRRKQRPLKVRMLDGTVKTVMVDDSKNVGDMLLTVCSRIGITNSEEYSLVNEEVDAKKDDGMGTLKKERSLLRDEKKMEKLKQKLHTDDDMNWLDHGRTLREQGVDDTETLLLRRKFFYSDQNVDSRDPVQLNLLYVQARDDILNGSHPVSFEKACEFGGYQVQIQFGPHSENKHKPGFLDLKDFLPKEYVKQRGAEKRIFQEHKKCENMSEMEAKVRYVRLARSLKTYGVSFFLVKEKMKGKNKLVPRLLGITKDCVMRVEERTKEEVQEWPLTTVKRWAASPKSFTLDFGDYSDGYYSVQTTEGEQIAKLIAGYIDIILKKKKSKDRFGMEGDEESTMLEDSVAPKKSTIMQQQSNHMGRVEHGSVALPAILRGTGGPEMLTRGTLPGSQQLIVSGQMHHGHLPPMSSNQQVLLGTITSSMHAVSQASTDMYQADVLPQLGQDQASMLWRKNKIQEAKHEIYSQLDAINASTASIVNLTSGDAADTDYTAVGCAVVTISSNLTEMSRGVRLLSALLDEEGGNGKALLQAARCLTESISGMLKSVQPSSPEPRQTVLTAASNVGQASNELLQHIGGATVDEQFQDTLYQLAKAVASSAAGLVLKAKAVAEQSTEQTVHNQVMGSATQCAISTSQLVACTKVVGPTLDSPLCQEQLLESSKLVARAVECCARTSRDATTNEVMMQQVASATGNVTQALNALLRHVRLLSAGNSGAALGPYDHASDTILTATQSIFNCTGDASEMVRQARLLAQATSDLINSIKMDAEAEGDQENSRKLLAAAKILADATAKMVEAAKGAAANPDSEEHRHRLQKAAEGLQRATMLAGQNAIKKKLIQRLETAARQAAAAATQGIAAAQQSADYNKNAAVQQQLVQSCKLVAEQIPQLVHGLSGSRTHPDSPSSQLALITASHNFLQPASKMVTAAKASVPMVADQASAMQLGQCAKNLASCLAELRTATQKAQESCGPLEIDSAMDMVRSLDVELQEAKKAASEGKLLPLPGETLEKCAKDLGGTSKIVGSSLAQVMSAASQGNENYTGIAARDTAQALRQLATAARGLAANTTDPAERDATLEASRNLMEKAVAFIQESKKAMVRPDDPANQQRLAQVAKAVSQALGSCVGRLPGQQDVDTALRALTEQSKQLLAQSIPQSSKSFQEAQSSLNLAAAGLNQAASELVAASRGSSQELSGASQKFGQDFGNFLDAGLEMAGQSKAREDQMQVVGNLKSISMSSSKLLLTAKLLCADPNAPNTKNQLALAARAVTDSINQLITTCTKQAPGHKECDNALRELEMVKGLLDNPSEAVNDQSYFECVDSVMDNSKVLGEAIHGISVNAKNSNLPDFGEAITKSSKALCGLMEAASQAAYLIGISDPNSQAGQPGLVDPAQFARANQAIQMACQNLVDPASNQAQVLSSATIVAKHTSALCNACRVASSRTTNLGAKRHFVQSAKDVANSTAHLVKAIKSLDGDFSEASREKCIAATAPLLESVECLTTFASNPEFVSIPASISPEGRKAQEPIVTPTKTMVKSSSEMIGVARSLAANPRDPPTWSHLASQSRTISDSIKRLITAVREGAPGQKECDKAISELEDCLRELGQASMTVDSQGLAPIQGQSLETLQEQVISAVQQIGNTIEPMAVAARGEAAQLGHKVSQMVSYFEPLVQASVAMTSRLLNHQQQANLLDQTRTLTESALQMLFAAKDAGGNPKATHTHEAIQESSQMMREAVEDITKTLNEAASELGMVSGMVDSITQAINKLDEGTPPEQDASFVDYQTKMVKTAKAITVTAQDMVSKSASDPADLGALASQLTTEYAMLAQQGRPAAAAAENEEVGRQIRNRVQELGHCCVPLVQHAGALHSSPTDSFTKCELVDSARKVSEKVSMVMAALQAGNRGTQACITAGSTVAGIIADLDTTVMFASTGTLNAEGDQTFADHREAILKTAKALVEDTKKLVAGAGARQEQLAQAAQSSVNTITRLADVVKLGAASLGSKDPETQVVLINAVKDVAKALGDLIGSTKSAAGKSSEDRSMQTLKGSAKIMVTNVTTLLKTVKAVEDEATKGTRALEATIECIKQQLMMFESREPPVKMTTPEEFIRTIKGITMATAKAVAAGNSCQQEGIVAMANQSRKAVSEMLTTCKQTAYHPDVMPELRVRAMRYGKECAEGYQTLLEHVLHVLQKPTAEGKQHLAVLSKGVASSVTELIQSAEAMKGSDWVDPEDPTVIAEAELLGAAAAIEAAAKKLEQLKPRKKPRQADESLNFEEQILEAAKAIAAATSALVKSASVAQRELVAQGKVGACAANGANDGQWSQGLISAARLVAAATSNLCEAANAAVQGHGSDEKLISSAKQVAASTAQLLVACMVKADPDSDAMRRLQVAGNAVKKASENLVKAAQKAAAFDEDEGDNVPTVKSHFVGGIAQIIAAQEEMLRKERELEDARRKLAQIRQQQYKFLPSELREDET